jgi:hypothetical protein
MGLLSFFTRNKCKEIDDSIETEDTDDKLNEFVYISNSKIYNIPKEKYYILARVAGVSEETVKKYMISDT